jgi:hypothetical protein
MPNRSIFRAQSLKQNGVSRHGNFRAKECSVVDLVVQVGSWLFVIGVGILGTLFLGAASCIAGCVFIYSRLRQPAKPARLQYDNHGGVPLYLRDGHPHVPFDSTSTGGSQQCRCNASETAGTSHLLKLIR